MPEENPGENPGKILDSWCSLEKNLGRNPKNKSLKKSSVESLVGWRNPRENHKRIPVTPCNFPFWSFWNTSWNFFGGFSKSTFRGFSRSYFWDLFLRVRCTIPPGIPSAIFLEIRINEIFNPAIFHLGTHGPSLHFSEYVGSRDSISGPRHDSHELYLS